MLFAFSGERLPIGSLLLQPSGGTHPQRHSILEALRRPESVRWFLSRCASLVHRASLTTSCSNPLAFYRNLTTMHGGTLCRQTADTSPWSKSVVSGTPHLPLVSHWRPVLMTGRVRSPNSFPTNQSCGELLTLFRKQSWF